MLGCPEWHNSVGGTTDGVGNDLHEISSSPISGSSGSRKVARAETDCLCFHNLYLLKDDLMIQLFNDIGFRGWVPVT